MHEDPPGFCKEELQQPVTRQSWDDVVESFLFLCNLAPELKGEQSRAILVQVFASRPLCSKIAFGKSLQEIGNGMNPLDDVVIALNEAASLIKGQSYAYSNAIQLEQAQINRVLSRIVGHGLRWRVHGPGELCSNDCCRPHEIDELHIYGPAPLGN